MPTNTRHAAILFILTMFLLLSTPTPSIAQEITTADAATVDFWNACQSIGVIPYDDNPLSVGWFDWYSIENPDDPALIPFCVVATVPPQTGTDTDTQPLTLKIRFYRGSPGSIDPAYLLAQIHANQQ